jgi:uncharacterized protein YceH (UPF0502 family)
MGKKDESVATTADKAQKRWGPLIAIVSTAVSITSVAVFAYASRASASDMEDAKQSIKVIEANVASVKESLDTLKSEMVASTGPRFDKEDQALADLAAKLTSLDKDVATLGQHVDDLRDELKK